MQEGAMREARVKVPQIALLAGTRVALGIGVGLLLAKKFGEAARKRTGKTLVAFGALSTIPLLRSVFNRETALHAA
jgi:hypothetical protein